MISNKVVLELMVAGRKIEFSCDPSMPLEDVRQATAMIDAYALNRIQEEMSKAQSEQPAEAIQ